MADTITPPDRDFLIRCPRLGHEIYFGYCRLENMGLPCFKILDCWFHYFAVEEYLRAELSQKEWEQVFVQPGKPKMVALAEAIAAARKEQD